MWPRSSYTLAPLTRITPNKRKFKWTKFEQDAFYEIKRIISQDTLLTYPYFNETFKIHTNTRAFQLGVIIIQKVKPIAFYIRKLNDPTNGIQRQRKNY